MALEPATASIGLPALRAPRCLCSNGHNIRHVCKTPQPNVGTEKSHTGCRTKGIPYAFGERAVLKQSAGAA